MKARLPLLKSLYKVYIKRSVLRKQLNIIFRIPLCECYRIFPLLVIEPNTTLGDGDYIGQNQKLKWIVRNLSSIEWINTAISIQIELEQEQISQ